MTTRADEAGQLLQDLLGMRLDQFTKVVLLPQGEFAAFLRADAEVRRSLLEQLFGTDRFAAVQQWLRETQAARRLEVEAADAGTARLLARAEQAAGMAGVVLPPEESAETDDGPGRVHALRARAEVALEEARQARVVAQERAQHAVAEHRTATETARLQARHAELLKRAESLAAQAPEQARRAERLAAAARAAGIARWLAPLEAAQARSAQALAAVDSAMVDLARCGPPRTPSSTTRPCRPGPKPRGSWSVSWRPSSRTRPTSRHEQAVAQARAAVQDAARAEEHAAHVMHEQLAAREHHTSELARAREAAAGTPPGQPLTTPGWSPPPPSRPSLSPRRPQA